MKVFTDIESVRQWRAQQGQVGVVPTMGYLHAGHMALIDAAKDHNNSVIATVFVNPTQFAATDDFASYPRDLDHDLTLLAQANVDAVFAPNAATMYPTGFQTQIEVREVSQGKEGGSRPGHFAGVATVVCKLLNITGADRAYFGQKDAQQVAVIRRMLADLNLPVQVVVCAIVREADGLAMSSRNVYLSEKERVAATVLYRSLQVAARAYDQGERHPAVLTELVHTTLAMEPLADTDYVDISTAATLTKVTTPTDEPLLLSMAVRIGQPRLLDNCLLPLELNTMEGATRTLGNPTPWE